MNQSPGLHERFRRARIFAIGVILALVGYFVLAPALLLHRHPFTAEPSPIPKCGIWVYDSWEEKCVPHN